jgi:hypothetical protein
MKLVKFFPIIYYKKDNVWQMPNDGKSKHAPLGQVSPPKAHIFIQVPIFK